MGSKRKYIPRDEMFGSIPVADALRTMAVPVVFSQLIVLVYNMADTFYIGKTDDPYKVAAASLIMPVFNMTLSIASITGIGGGTLISRLLGAKKHDEVRQISSFCIYLAAVLTALFSLIMAVFMRPILLLLGADENTMRYAIHYASVVVVLGGIPTVLSNVMAHLVRCVGLPREAGTGITLGGVLNIILDPIFMFLLMPKDCEVLGAAVATLIANCIVCVYFASVIVFNNRDIPLTFSLKVGLPSAKNMLSVFTGGVPSAVATVLFDVDYIVVDKLMSSCGAVALAAVGIVLKAERIPLNTGVGICQAMTPLVAYNYSSGDHKRMNEIIALSLKTGVVVAVLSIMGYELTAPYISHLFIAEPHTAELAGKFLRIRALAAPFMFISFLRCIFFRGSAEGIYRFHSALYAGCCLISPCFL